MDFAHARADVENRTQRQVPSPIGELMSDITAPSLPPLDELLITGAELDRSLPTYSLTLLEVIRQPDHK